MKKYILGMLAAVCLTLVLTPAVRAANVVSYAVTGGSIQFDKDTGMVTNCDESVTKADIPPQIEGISVISIGDEAFYNSGLTSVTIPNSVTSIGDLAFCNCAYLTSVTIPNSVTSIGDEAFYNSGLTSVTIPNSVTSIGEGAFRRCDSLTNVTIPNRLTFIADLAFSDCSSLTSVTIPNSVISIGKWAFGACSSLTGVTIPNSVTSIGSYAFCYSNSLTAIMVTEDNPSYSSIDGVLFNKAGTILLYYPEGKSGAYSIPSGVTSIGDWSFSYCSGLTSLSVPDTVTSVGELAFNMCDKLADVYYDGTQAEYKTKLLPGISNNGNNRFLNAVHFKDDTSPDPPSPNPTLPNTAASDNTTLHGTIFLLLSALTLTVWVLGRKKKDNQTNK